MSWRRIISGALVAIVSACGARSELIARRPDAFAPPEDVGADSQRPPECMADPDCNDRVDCTADRCVGGRCTHAPNDARCDDGLFCTAGDRCDPLRGCVSAPRDCTDAVACTTDRCDDFVRSCVHASDDRLCPISHRCDATRGCIARALAVDSSQLYEVELPGVVVRPIGRTGVVITDLALAPDRSLYGVGANALYGIDSRTGVATQLIALMGDFTALDAAPDGTLYAGAGNTLFRIDPASGVVSARATYPVGLEASGDLAAYGDALVATARAAFNGPDTLVAFDVTAGTSRVLGPIGFTCVYGLAAFGVTLYGLTCEGRVLRIDATTGAGVELASASVHFYGATAR